MIYDLASTICHAKSSNLSSSSFLMKKSSNLSLVIKMVGIIERHKKIKAPKRVQYDTSFLKSTVVGISQNGQVVAQVCL